MGNVLSDAKQQQVLALGRLGWSLRRIEQATGVRRETAAGYLARAGIGRRGRGRPGSKPAIEVTTDFGAGLAPPAAAPAAPSRSASLCGPWREVIEQGLGLGRNAMAIWQDLVSDHGFTASYQNDPCREDLLGDAGFASDSGCIAEASGGWMN
ncbi:MAG: hypothetical protein ACRD1M_11965 [Terriglobales bacterium]